MKVRAWYSKIERSDENSSVLLVGGKRVELPNDAFKTGARNSVILEKSIAEKHGLRWKLLFHIPPKIAPVYNQICIDELRIKPTVGC